MKQHRTHTHNSLWMVLACILPMGLIFLLPALGVNIGVFWWLVPLLCVGSHFFMMRGHQQGGHDDPHDPPAKKEETP